MTILPNKKQSKDKNENENKEHFGSHGSNDGRTSRRSPPPVQRNSMPQREAIRTSVLDSGAGIDEFATHELITKKRHRLSPHRSSRKQRSSVEKERGNTSKSVNLASFNAGSPSFSGSTSRLSYRNPPPAITSSSSSSHEELDDDTENPEGYNSGDEYGPRECPEDAHELEVRFERALKEKRGYTIKKVGQDGACLFRAVADQVFGDEEHHVIVRRDCTEYMAKNADYFKQFVTEDFNEYLKRKRKPNAHGNYVEMQAMCEMYNRPIEIYQYSLDPINIFHCAYETDNEPIRLSYHGNIHYNSVIDPFKATIGVGLGLPGHQPGLADKTLMSDALKMSEEHDIEKTMLEDKVKETDWEVTQEAIDEQVARESYLQWLRDQEKLEKSTAAPSASAACCSASTSKASSGEVRAARSPDHVAPPPFLSTDLDAGQEMQLTSVMTPAAVQSTGDVAGAEAIDPDMSLFGLADWDDDDILAEVMRRSQAEYLDSLKKSNTASGSNNASTVTTATTSSNVDASSSSSQ